MITENKNTQPNTLKCHSTWKQVEIQPVADSQLPVELLYNQSTTKIHNKVDPSWRKMCNFEVKATLWEWHREDKTAVNI